MTFPNSPELPVALYRAAQVREFDRRAIEDHGIPGYTLMTRAATAAFAALCAHWPQARRILVACGGGNNGGDGYVLARLAQQAGLSVRLVYLSDPERLKGDAATAYRDAVASGIVARPFTPEDCAWAEVIVDALLGTGLEREVRDRWRMAIEAINAAPAATLAIDIPSGLHSDSGTVLGSAVQAELTVSFIGLKQGLFTAQGPGNCGEIVFDALGVPEAVYAGIEPGAQRYTGDDIPQLLPPRPRTAHKGRHGHVLVIGGDQGMAGAARLAAEAAARCGAGLVSIATRSEHAPIQAAVRPELMFRGVESAADLKPLLERTNVIALGPGLGQNDWGQLLWEAALASDLPLVIDADALNLLAQKPQQRERWILTPHPGEAGRLLGSDAASVEADRFAAVTELAGRFGGVIVLKGAGSLIAASNSRPLVCNTGNPGMASGGMGDVLTGVIAGLWAQGLEPEAAARAGVCLHGRAGDAAAQDGERGMLAGDLLPWLRRYVNPELP